MVAGPIIIPVEEEMKEFLFPNDVSCKAFKEHNSRVKRNIYDVAKVREVNEKLKEFTGKTCGERSTLIKHYCTNGAIYPWNTSKQDSYSIVFRRSIVLFTPVLP